MAGPTSQALSTEAVLDARGRRRPPPSDERRRRCRRGTAPSQCVRSGSISARSDGTDGAGFVRARHERGGRRALGRNGGWTASQLASVIRAEDGVVQWESRPGRLRDWGRREGPNLVGGRGDRIRARQASCGNRKCECRGEREPVLRGHVADRFHMVLLFAFRCELWPITDRRRPVPRTQAQRGRTPPAFRSRRRPAGWARIVAPASRR